MPMIARVNTWLENISSWFNSSRFYELSYNIIETNYN